MNGITGHITVRLAGPRDPMAESLDVSMGLDREDRRRLTVLEQAPDGTEVTVDIGNRRYVSHDAIHEIHRHRERLRIVIDGADFDAVRRWVSACRSGQWDAA